jgi:transposase
MVQDDLIAHFQKLRRRFRKPLVIVLDNLSSHKSRRLKAWCKKVGDVHLEYLPAYAPELNPIEWTWGHSKNHGARGRIANDRTELHELAQTSIEKASEHHLLQANIRATKIPFQMNLKKRKFQC